MSVYGMYYYRVFCLKRIQGCNLEMPPRTRAKRLRLANPATNDVKKIISPPYMCLSYSVSPGLKIPWYDKNGNTGLLLFSMYFNGDVPRLLAVTVNGRRCWLIPYGVRSTGNWKNTIHTTPPYMWRQCDTFSAFVPGTLLYSVHVGCRSSVATGDNAPRLWLAGAAHLPVVQSTM